MRCSCIRLTQTLSKATRLQLGNLKTDYGEMSTAAGSKQKWGHFDVRPNHPILQAFFLSVLTCTLMFASGVYSQYRDMLLLQKYICYEDIQDRCLIPIPGENSLKPLFLDTILGYLSFRKVNPLQWFPFELKLGDVKQASY